ncbi:MAG TPA: sulfatase-like hydrolase/transferase [Xanthobacteraceae bacterium]|nr:sulfatase-like hydrolase/transferase [Xanthobacteraceae bacterium]
MSQRPNILFFITDQLRADHLGCYGNQTIRTPAIDQFAARGVSFDRFYVASPVCQPNRATLMTGRMPSLHGVRHNGISLSLNATTFVDLLRASGWKTALIGKSHLQNMTGTPTVVPAPTPPAGFSGPPAGLNEAEKHDRNDDAYEQENGIAWDQNPDRKIRLPYYGFDHVELCSGHATEVHGTYTGWLRARRPDADRLRGPDNALPSDYVLPQAWRTSLPEELYPTSYVVERTLAFLDRHAGERDAAPFFLQCSFPDPHHPFTPPGRYWEMYKPQDMALPKSFHLGNRALPPHAAHLIAERDAGTRKATTPGAFAVNERETREAIALTFGMIAMIDDGIARILKRLDELGLTHNTVLVFTSDHGDLMGDHQLMLKGAYAYQGLIRVPFIWVEPSHVRAAARSDALFGTFDIAATFLDRARLAPYNGLQGRSMLPAIAGDNTAGHDGILVEYGSQRPVTGLPAEFTMRTLVDDRWRITLFRGVPWGELYDLASDPHEMHNLWDDPAHAADKLVLLERLAQKMMELSERSPRPTHVA